MSLDTSIALQYRAPEIQSPLNAFAQYAQIQQAQNQNALAQYQIQQAQRAQESENAFNRAYQGAFDPTTGQVDYTKLRGNLANSNLGSRIPVVEKQISEQQTAQAKLQQEQSNLVDSKLKQSRELLSGVRTPEQYLNWAAGQLNDPALGPVLKSYGITPDSVVNNLKEHLGKPGGFNELLTKAALNVEKFAELNKPHYTTQDVGGSTQIVATPGLGGAATVVPGSVAQKTMAPGEAERIGLQRQQLGLEGARVGLEQQRVGIALHEAANKQSDRDFSDKFGITKQEAQKRESTLPQTAGALNNLNQSLDSLIQSTEELKKHPGLSGATGKVNQWLPTMSQDTADAESLLNNIKSKVLINTINSMKAMSKTGASGFGALSDKEAEKIQNSIASLDPKQGTEAMKKSLTQIANYAKQLKDNATSTFNDTYSYRNKAPVTVASPSPAPAPAAAGKTPSVSNW